MTISMAAATSMSTPAAPCLYVRKRALKLRRCGPPNIVGGFPPGLRAGSAGGGPSRSSARVKAATCACSCGTSGLFFYLGGSIMVRFGGPVAMRPVSEGQQIDVTY
jgi:hypothetical protein